MLVEPLIAVDPESQNSTKKVETNNTNNEPTTNGFHSHFNGIAIRVTLMWQSSSARSRLCYLAVGCCNKPSCVVNVTPDHIVGKIRLQHQELGIDLEL